MDISIDQRFLEIVLCCREYFLSPFEIVAMAIRNVNQQETIAGNSFAKSIVGKKGFIYFLVHQEHLDY
jgi:hypothetical protein